jgi:hypothetical protein
MILWVLQPEFEKSEGYVSYDINFVRNLIKYNAKNI